MSGVSVQRGTSLLLDGLNWHVDDLERWVVVGPNGAGKTTALTIAATRMFPTSELRPRIGFASSALLRDIPMHESAVDVVVTGAYAVTGRWKEEYHEQDVDRAQTLLAQWGASGYASRPFASLSEGERKRVLIARALMSDPELLLLDEPGAGLDLAGREELVALLGRFASDPFSPSLVLVTHHLEEIPPGITHALLLANGRVIAAGPVHEALTNEHMSDCYGIPLVIASAHGRWMATYRRAS